MDSSVSVTNIGAESTSIMLNREQAEALRSLIDRHTNCKLSTYIASVGLESSNVYAILSGRRKLTLQTLQRLLSGTDLTVQCQIEFLIQKNGGHASDVHYPSLEEQLSSEIGEESERDRLTEVVFPSITEDTLIHRRNKD